MSPLPGCTVGPQYRGALALPDGVEQDRQIGQQMGIPTVRAALSA